MAGPQFTLEDLDFCFCRAAPEFAIEIAATPRMTRVIFKSRGIANRIDRKMEIFCELRFGRDFGEKRRRRQRARRFVAVNRREQTKANGIAAVWAVKNKARQ